nr:retrovirus-related Pol polyprotein from transposon TNT 1-94 [Tanacetum cinerariifolium]
MQTQTSNTLHNAIMEAGGKDLPPMLAPRNYVKWKSRIKRYIDTKPNHELIYYCLLNPPYKYTWADKAVPITEGIDNDIYSTIVACPNACEMLKSIERLKQGELINVQDLESNLYWEFGHFISRDGESLESYYSRFYKMMNGLAGNQCDATNHQVNVQFLLQVQPEWKRIGNVAGARETVGTTVLRKFGIQCYNCKEFGHVSRECQKPKWAKDASYHKKKMLLCKQEEAGFQLNVEQADWRDDIDDEPKDQELEAHYMYMVQIQEVNPDAVDNSCPIFDSEPLQKDDDDDLANERDLLASLIEKLKCEIDDSKNRNKFLETSNKALVDKLKGQIEDYKNKNKSLESSNNHFKEANNELSKTNELMYKDLKKFQAKLDRHNDVKYALKMEINCAKAKGELMSYKMESKKSFNAYTQKIKDLNQTISEIKKELFAHQETISILSQQIEAQIKFHKTREDKELDNVIALENKIKVLDNIVYKTGQTVQTMNILNRNCKTSFAKPEFLKKTQRANPCLYDIGCYNDNLALMLAPESDEVICLEKESRSKLSDLIRPFDYEKLKNLYDLFVPQRKKSSTQRYFSKRINVELEKFHLCLKEEMVADLRYFNSLELEVDSLKSQLETHKTQFLNEIDQLLREYYYVDHMNAILGVYTELDEEVEDHRRNVKFSKNKTSVNACNDNLNAKTSNVNFVCVRCGKCVLKNKHDMCVLYSLNGVNSRTKMPMAVPISTREPKHIINQSVAKPLRRIVALESSNEKPRHTNRKLYENVKIILFIVDSGCSKHITGNLKLLINFMEKFLGTVKFGNDKIAPIIGYGDLVQGTVTIIRVYYVKELNHNLFSVGQFCDADLEVAFWKSTCYIHDLKGNDLLTGSCGTDLYYITLQDTTSPNPIRLMAKATSSQAWLWHRRLFHLNFDTINLLSKNDIVIGLPKLKFVKDHLCSSCELGKSKQKSFQTKTTPSSKRWLQLLHVDLCGPMRVESINGRKYVLVIVDDYSRYTWTHFLRSKVETPEVLIDFLRLV